MLIKTKIKIKKHHFFQTMAVFPHEVLNLIFVYLSTRDLLHCQLVNSIWNEASVRLLYSDICLNFVQTELYIRTISNSSRLSSYLKYIDFGWQLAKRNNEVWKKDELLSILLQHCPNILELHAYNPSPEVWTRLMYASKEGQLTHLQCLPIHTGASQIDSYAYATLFFKDTLTTLLLCDDKTNSISTNWANSEGCQTVLSYITEFRQLQHLSVGSHTSQPLDSFDALIEDCRHLKSFSVRLYPVKQTETEGKTNRAIYPRHGIHKLTCDWEMIKGDDQLKYIMLKFPSLQDLKILFDPFTADVSLQREPRATSFKIITEFLHYAFDIPKLVFEFYLDKDDLIHVWTQFMKKNDKHRKIGISYIPNYHDPSKIVMHVKEDTSKIMFPLKNSDLSLPHVDFLAANGNLIQSLTIESMWEVQTALKPTSTIYDRLKKEDWIHRILQLCPFLQELTFSNSKSMLISENVLFHQHREIKKFAFDIFKPDMSFGFLRCLSLNLPNLQQLQFGFHDWFELDDFYCIKIDMPYTKFDLIICTEILRQEDTEYYIRLKTSVAEKFFVVDQDQLLTIPEQQICKKSSKQLYFDITCQQLDAFKVTWAIGVYETRHKTNKWHF